MHVRISLHIESGHFGSKIQRYWLHPHSVSPLDDTESADRCVATNRMNERDDVLHVEQGN